MENHSPDQPPIRRGARTQRTASIGLMPLGAGLRLLAAALIVAALWGGFFWATASFG